MAVYACRDIGDSSHLSFLSVSYPSFLFSRQISIPKGDRKVIFGLSVGGTLKILMNGCQNHLSLSFIQLHQPSSTQQFTFQHTTPLCFSFSISSFLSLNIYSPLFSSSLPSLSLCRPFCSPIYSGGPWSRPQETKLQTRSSSWAPPAPPHDLPPMSSCSAPATAPRS